MILAFVTIAFVVSIYAQDSSRKIPLSKSQIAFAKKNLLMGLRSGNNGVMESSLILISKIKINFCETNVAEIRNVIDSLALASPSGAFRYKAYLVSNICAYPEWFAIDNALNTLERDLFFVSASRLLQQKMLATEPS